MKENDTFTSDGGKKYVVGEQLSYKGQEDCQDPRCTRMGGTGLKLEDGSFDMGVCIGWHCPRCGEPCSMMGHNCD